MHEVPTSFVVNIQYSLSIISNSFNIQLNAGGMKKICFITIINSQNLEFIWTNCAEVSSWCNYYFTNFGYLPAKIFVVWDEELWLNVILKLKETELKQNNRAPPRFLRGIILWRSERIPSPTHREKLFLLVWCFSFWGGGGEGGFLILFGILSNERGKYLIYIQFSCGTVFDKAAFTPFNLSSGSPNRWAGRKLGGRNPND